MCEKSEREKKVDDQMVTSGDDFVCVVSVCFGLMWPQVLWHRISCWQGKAAISMRTTAAAADDDGHRFLSPSPLPSLPVSHAQRSSCIFRR